MAFLSLLILGLAFAGAAAWLFTWWSDERSRTEFAKRNIKYIPQGNAFLQTIRKERQEEPKHKLIQKEGKVFGFNFLNAYTICVAEPEIAQSVFSKEFTSFSNRRVSIFGFFVWFFKNTKNNIFLFSRLSTLIVFFSKMFPLYKVKNGNVFDP